MSPEDKYSGQVDTTLLLKRLDALDKLSEIPIDARVRVDRDDAIAWLDGREPKRWVDDGTHAEPRQDFGRVVFVPAGHGIYVFPLLEGDVDV